MNLLDNVHVPYEVRDCYGTPQVCYPNTNTMICDVVCHSGSYGGSAGLLEIMGLVDFQATGDSVEGWLSAEEVARRIIAHYQNS